MEEGQKQALAYFCFEKKSYIEKGMKEKFVEEGLSFLRLWMELQVLKRTSEKELKEFQETLQAENEKDKKL